MLKGVSRRVVMVKSPDPEIFEQAIFIVREDYLKSQTLSSRELVRQAQTIADGFAKSMPKKTRTK